jgi:Rrf2 family protein
MLSKRAKYAIKALLYLHANSEVPTISAKTIAENERIPYKFLENILRELRQHKMLKSVRGSEGGYRLLKKPGEIKVAEIIRIVDGPIALIPCISENFYEKCDECLDEKTCQIRKLFGQVRLKMLPVLELSIAELNEL